MKLKGNWKVCEGTWRRNVTLCDMTETLFVRYFIIVKRSSNKPVMYLLLLIVSLFQTIGNNNDGSGLLEKFREQQWAWLSFLGRTNQLSDSHYLRNLLIYCSHWSCQWVIFYWNLPLELNILKFLKFPNFLLLCTWTKFSNRIPKLGASN